MEAAAERMSRLAGAAVILLVMPLCAVAETLYFPQPPPPERPGWEASTNAVLNLTDSGSRYFRIRMSVNGSLHNCAMLEFGVDANANGCLERNEVEMSVGWDCGEWTCRDRVNGLRSMAARQSGLRRMDFLMNVRGMDSASYLLDARDGGSLFSDISHGGLFNPSWNMVRLVTRGDSPLESASVRLFHEPFIIKIQ